MKKTSISIMLVLILIASLSVCAFADQTNDEIGYIPTIGEAIGSLSDQDGMDIAPNYSRSTGLPFSMTATEVKNMLTTYNSSGKKFNGGAFDGLVGEGLKITGSLTHSYGSEYTIKVGACYYNASNDTFYAVSSSYFKSGVYSSTFVPKLDGMYINFKNSQTYYGYITNHNGVGSVSGSLSFSVATE